MITGSHILFYSDDAEADRAFFRDVLEFHSVDAGQGWLIFALPPAEAGLHPTDEKARVHEKPYRVDAEFYFMCDELDSTIKWLGDRNVVCSPPNEAPWGITTTTTIPLPIGGEIGLYEPRHPTAHS